MNKPNTAVASTVTLWWLPVGAGGYIVRHTSRWWEFLHARFHKRAPRALFHAALEVTVDSTRFVIEMTPAWGVPRSVDRGVVAVGPVGLHLLGRCRFFRYEIRCWPNGTIPDLRWARGGPVALTYDPEVGRALVNQIRDVPVLTWGRRVQSSSDMWNSNSLVSWLLASVGMDVSKVSPPDDGWAPGWQAGLAVASTFQRNLIAD